MIILPPTYRIVVTAFLLLISLKIAAQNHLKPVFVEKEEGSYQHHFQDNGKISTELFTPKKQPYGSAGHAKAWNQKGKLIYEKPISRSAMIRSVRFSYFKNGAVSKAEFSSHPDGGIQWSKEITSFDENGNVTDVLHLNHDDRNTITHPQFPPKPNIPGVTQLSSKPQVVNKDSLEFYHTFINKDPTGSLVHERRAYPDQGYTLTTWTSVGKLTRDMTIFYKPSGIKVIHRTFHFLGGIETQSIEEVNGKTHFTRFDENGIVIEEVISNP